MVCSHGDVIPDMLRILKATTTRFREPVDLAQGVHLGGHLGR